ncbi:hypothetical protein [Saccharibacillus alkalitolerans]|uniref:Uncharacterized protein n=1 Tax=Saccharibacillus alkalitolerans TaxID=2705290 RepID=A0ABX0F3S6_9BACL|nr:hypothetical protein [Saccharibacillus alkalitolerans]NGZ75140.1 hypothetical protein [Saccharibacillus alkalitolerans]
MSQKPSGMRLKNLQDKQPEKPAVQRDGRPKKTSGRYEPPPNAAAAQIIENE